MTIQKTFLLLLLLLLGLSINTISAVRFPGGKSLKKRGKKPVPAPTQIARDALRLSLEDVHTTIRFIEVFSGLHTVHAIGSTEAHNCAGEIIEDLRHVRSLLRELQIELRRHPSKGMSSTEESIGDVKKAIRSSFGEDGRRRLCYKAFEEIDGEMEGMVQRRIESMVSSANAALDIVERSGMHIMGAPPALPPAAELPF
ncbi:hypothetical protein QJS04_geneDACA013554 [Acorus gramineus]|uniref:Uncharacterized protein n=1 Tax=Acorus gramineus TaxID=55184 RepID=A0AAV9AGM6_ACOGR|nr:hypothetical protein QJS04_geneDACA013554 [Acorus gramineus]